jgi:beta-lactamase class C
MILCTIRGSIFFFIIFVLSSSLSYGQAHDSTWIEHVHHVFQNFTNKITNRAAVVGVYEKGQDSLLVFGRINLFGRKPDGNDIFQLGSVTKTFTGYLFAKAIVEDHLEPESLVSAYLKIKETGKYQNTSLLSLATHTSGLPNNTVTILAPTLVSYVAAITAFNRFFLVPLDAPQVLIDVPWKIAIIPPLIPYFTFYGKNALNFDLNLYGPNKKKVGAWHYSNIGMGLLGKLLAENKKFTFEELLIKEFTDKYNLTNTTVSLSKNQKRNFATPHNILGFRTVRTKFHRHGIVGAGGIRSTGNDMLKYLKLQLEGISSSDSVIFKKQQKSYFISEDPKQKGLEMGLGWIKYNPPNDDNHTIYWHNGQVTGSSAFIGFIPDKKIGIFILSNNAKAKKLTRLGFKLLRGYVN